MKKNKLMLFLLIVVLISLFIAFDLDRFFTLDYFSAQQDQIGTFYQHHPLLSALLFFLVYVLTTAGSLPGATVLTLAGGAIFGALWGTVIVSFASTIGATLAFLASRYLLRDWVQTKFAGKLATINRGIAKEGGFYLFTLRLLPIFPFFVINLLFGVTRLRAWTFCWVSQAGMLAGTWVFVNAGAQLGQLKSVAGILSPGLLLSFALLGLLPLVSKRAITYIQARKILVGFVKPTKFDTNLIVIGAGSAGLVSAYIAAAVKAKVTLIEKHKMGGDCLNTGCVPSKALIATTKLIANLDRVQAFGLKSASYSLDFSQVMARVQRIVKTIAPHDSVERFEKLGVDCIAGEAKLLDPYTVQVNGRTLTAPNIIIATGARPTLPPIPGIDQVNTLTSDSLWDLQELPKRLVVLGGGPIGCELAQCFARLGSKVTQIERFDRLLIREDPEVSETIYQSFVHAGIAVYVQTQAVAFEHGAHFQRIICQQLGGGDKKMAFDFDYVLVAVGRTANIAGFGLEALGVELNPNHTLSCNDFMATNYPNIFACGDVAGPYQFTHTAAHQAWYAAVNALFGSFKKFKANYQVIPAATFCDPEVARVGLNEIEAKQQNIPYEITRYGIDDLDRAITDEEAHGMVKVLTVPGKDKILGVTIVGQHAGDLIAEYVLAMTHGLGLNKILGTIHIYPTLTEANKYAAGAWKRAHAPEKLLSWVERYHHWRRS